MLSVRFYGQVFKRKPLRVGFDNYLARAIEMVVHFSVIRAYNMDILHRMETWTRAHEVQVSFC